MITEGPVKIVMSVKEVDKHHIWMRPNLDRPGYTFLVFEAPGWVPICPMYWNNRCKCNYYNEIHKGDGFKEPFVREGCDTIKDDIESPCECK